MSKLVRNHAFRNASRIGPAAWTTGALCHISGSCQQAGFQPVFSRAIHCGLPRSQLKRTLKIAGSPHHPQTTEALELSSSKRLCTEAGESSAGLQASWRLSPVMLLWTSCLPGSGSVSGVPLAHRATASPVLPQPVPSRPRQECAGT